MKAGAPLRWEYAGEKKPLIEPGEYEGIVLGWEHRHVFGRDEIRFEVQLLGDPSDGQPPAEGIAARPGLILYAHFNVRTVRGVAQLGPGSKFVRALAAVFDGTPPPTPDPDCLTGRKVRCLVETVRHDSKKTPLHPSSFYSTITTFLGPGGNDDPNPLPFSTLSQGGGGGGSRDGVGNGDGEGVGDEKATEKGLELNWGRG